MESAQPVFTVCSVRARDAGATLCIEPSEVPSGARTFGLEDRGGNLITFVEAA